MIPFLIILKLSSVIQPTILCSCPTLKVDVMSLLIDYIFQMSLYHKMCVVYGIVLKDTHYSIVCNLLDTRSDIASKSDLHIELVCAGGKQYNHDLLHFCLFIPKFFNAEN